MSTPSRKPWLFTDVDELEPCFDNLDVLEPCYDTGEEVGKMLTCPHGISREDSTLACI